MAFVLVALTILGLALADPEEGAGGGATTSLPPTPTQSSSRPASPRPTPTPTPAPTSRAHPTATTFTNDGYQVPAPLPTPPKYPYPQSQQQASTRIHQNGIYSAPVGVPVRCPLDPAVQKKGMAADDLAHAVNLYVDCLMGVWRVPMEAAGYPLNRPGVIFYNDVATSPCGNRHSSEMAGMYCGSNSTFYLPYDQRVYTNGDGWPTYELEVVIGHEFAHHVQARAGIGGGLWYIEYESGIQQLELRRREELQAQCFAGLALNAASYSMGLTAADRKTLIAGESQRGDQPGEVRDHGTPANSGLWFSRGLASTSVSTCNTFIAPASEVD